MYTRWQPYRTAMAGIITAGERAWPLAALRPRSLSRARQISPDQPNIMHCSHSHDSCWPAFLKQRLCWPAWHCTQISSRLSTLLYLRDWSNPNPPSCGPTICHGCTCSYFYLTVEVESAEALRRQSACRTERSYWPSRQSKSTRCSQRWQRTRAILVWTKFHRNGRRWESVLEAPQTHLGPPTSSAA